MLPTQKQICYKQGIAIFIYFNLLFLDYVAFLLKNKGKDGNLEYEYLERRKRGHRKLNLEKVLISKTVISNLISKKLTSIEDTQYRSWLLGTWVSNLQMC
jgi:hypothetical protein